MTRYIKDGTQLEKEKGEEGELKDDLSSPFFTFIESFFYDQTSSESGEGRGD